MLFTANLSVEKGSRAPGDGSTQSPKAESRPSTQSSKLEGLALLLVEDDDLIRESLLDWLASVFLDSHLVGASSREVTASDAVESPQVIVADIALSGDDGLDTVRALSRAFEEARVVALVRGGHGQPCDAVVAAGADACLLIWEMHEQLVPTVRRLLMD
jgi:DNA-binding NarL/FixJ family response regulator